jgi:hypothetical protein
MEARAGKDTRGAASPSKRQQFARQEFSIWGWHPPHRGYLEAFAIERAQ